MAKDFVIVRFGIYTFRLSGNPGNFDLMALQGTSAGVLVREVQDGEAFAQAVREMFRDVSNEHLEFRKGLRRVFKRFYRKFRAYVPGARAFYLRIINQNILNELGEVHDEEAPRGLWG